MRPRARRALALLAAVGGLALPCGVATARANVSTLGGPVMHSERTHVIFWAPAGSGLSFDPAYEQLIDSFLRRVAAASRSAGNVFGLIGQYRGAGGPAAYASTFGGAVLDSDPLPSGPASSCQEPPPPPAGEGPGWTVCADDGALQAEIRAVVRSRGLATGLEDVYFLVLPSGFASCFGSGPLECAVGGDSEQGYCGYHAVIGSAPILYAVIPYNALPGHCRSDRPRPNRSAADPAIVTIAHELAEAATDPLGNGWTDDSGNEIADICLHRFGPDLGGSSGSTAYNQVIGGGHYFLQDLWSNADHACEAAAPPDRVKIAAPARAARGAAVALSASASAPHRTIVSYTWAFGDGGSARGPEVRHTFARVGSHTATLTVVDSWGDERTAARRVRVVR